VLLPTSLTAASGRKPGPNVVQAPARLLDDRAFTQQHSSLDAASGLTYS
jgi:hypothetical protein